MLWILYSSKKILNAYSKGEIGWRNAIDKLGRLTVW